MKICILTPHLIESHKQANIHIIYSIIKKNGHEVDFVTYPVSLTYFLKHNRFRMKAFFRGYFKQRFIYTFLPGVSSIKNKLLLLLCDKFIFFFGLYKNYDILIGEGPSISPVIRYIKYKYFIYRMSDHPEYCGVSDKILFKERGMAKDADLILSVLKKNAHNERVNFRYFPNPSLYNKTLNVSKKNNECVYIGSNKVNRKALLGLADKGIKIHIYSEYININHVNIIFHGLIEKEKIVNTISKYRVGLIPFHLDSKNKHMEIPLKVFDYIAAELKVFMLTSSETINKDVIDVSNNINEYIVNVKSYIESSDAIDRPFYNEFLSSKSLANFEADLLLMLDEAL